MFKLKSFLLVTNKLNRICRLDPRMFTSHGKVPKDESALKFVVNQKWKQAEDSSVSEDAPVKYSTSSASTFKAAYTRSGRRVDRLWYEPYVIIVSIGVFMIYFTILREENDLDEELSRSLYDRIDGLEESQLKMSIAYNKEFGGDTIALVKRLEEIEMQKEFSKKT